ncbi:hypothetical protein CK203_063819 [Vitis vinifera]|uniref:Uncharacterized protein n=1 Tax=Vitis vinifera TaxID=29760 RepID=A0A438GBA8_VITVI|nr:hypothetical protein CK203_063819 [Vitis vinifera]
MEEAKTMKTPMSSSIKLDKDEKDANFASCKVERKNTSGTCHFLGHSLVSWHRERQLPPSLRASALLSHLSLSKWRLAKKASPRFGPLCQNLSLERLFRGCADLQMPKDGQTIGTQPDRVQPSPSSHDLLHLIATRRTSRQGLLSGGFHSGLHSNGKTNSCRVSDDDAYDILLETNFEAPTSYDTYDEQSWGERSLRRHLMAPGLGELSDLQHRPRTGIDASRIEEEVEIKEMEEGIHVEATFSEPMMTESSYTAGPSSQSSSPASNTEIPSRHLTLLIMHLGWIGAYGSTTGYSEHFQQSIERIESCQVSQHEEMMAYLRSVFPPPLPQP